MQSALQPYFLKRKTENDLTVDIQDAARTNALLAQKGVTLVTVATFTPEQLAGLLGVDSIISGTLVSS